MELPMRLLATALLAAALPSVLALNAMAQAPGSGKPITIVVPFAAGGPSDAMARLIAQGLGEITGSRVMVENTPGAGGTLGSARVSKADPDGTTLVFGNIGTHAANVGLYKSLPYNPETDFAPVSLVASVPFVVSVKKPLPVSDFAGFRALAGATDLNFGSAGIGSASHLACLLLNAALGGKSKHIPYRGVAPAMNDLVGGQIDFMCDQTVTMIPQIQSNTIKPLAVMSGGRVAQLPQLPTLAEAGLPNVEVEAWNAIFAPKGTPDAVTKKLSEQIQAALQSPAIRDRLQSLGAVIPTGDAAGPEALRRHVAAEVRKWVPIIRDAGASVD
jgi:tripartite-type tricarboxylate transporter receptor subunit TctC